MITRAARSAALDTSAQVASPLPSTSLRLCALGDWCRALRATSYAKYLAAKKTVDDSALNADVLRCLRTRLHAGGDRELRVLEIGAGLGTMPARLIELGILRRASYTMLDADRQLLEHSSRWLSAWAQAANRTCREEVAVLVCLVRSSKVSLPLSAIGLVLSMVAMRVIAGPGYALLAALYRAQRKHMDDVASE